LRHLLQTDRSTPASRPTGLEWAWETGQLKRYRRGSRLHRHGQCGLFRSDNGTNRVFTTRVKKSSTRRAFAQRDLVRENKGSGAVVELNQEHQPIQVIYFAQDPRLFAEMRTTLVISDRPQKPATVFSLGL
jgi:hypothetical protein